MSEPTTLTTDPEILALLDFEPVPRRARKEDGWTAEMQRLFIARLAVHGSPGKACNELRKYRSGIDKVFHSKGAESFRDAWAAAVELAEQRRVEEVTAGQAGTADIKMPFVDNRRKTPAGQADANGKQPLAGQVLNEDGEWEDEQSYLRRAEEAKDSIAMKLTRCRRLYLHEISGCEGKRAAFEILTEYPLDWEKAALLEPQPFEPWTPTNQRQPDMVLTNENGWGLIDGYGPEKKARLRAAIDRHRAEAGLPPVNWDGQGKQGTSRGMNPT
jgi:hypothetical protein